MAVEASTVLGLADEQRDGTEDVLRTVTTGDEGLGRVVEAGQDIALRAAERRERLGEFLRVALTDLAGLLDLPGDGVAVPLGGGHGLDVALGDGLDLQHGTDRQL